EGVPLGSRFSSLWMPLRMVGAMAALAPIVKGLSIFQVALLGCIGFSINLGNYVWELGTDYFVEHGGQITVQAPDQNVTQYASIANGTLESLTLQYYLNQRRDLDVEPGGEWKYSDNWLRSGGSYRFQFNGDAGQISVDCVDEGDALCRGKVNAVGSAISSLSSVAQKLADPSAPASDIDPTALYRAANQINATILSELQDYARQGQLKGKLKDFKDISDQYGWFIAGSSYWSIAWINQEVREAMYSGISYSPRQYTSSELFALTYGLRDYEAVRERVANYIKTAYATRRGISDTTAMPSVTGEERAFDELASWLRATLNQLVASNILPVAVESCPVRIPSWLSRTWATTSSARHGDWPPRSASSTFPILWAKNSLLSARLSRISTSTSPSLCSPSFCRFCSMASLWLTISQPFRSSAGFPRWSAGSSLSWNRWSPPLYGWLPMHCRKEKARRVSTENEATSSSSASLSGLRSWSAASLRPSSS
ncbi:MAG: DotA/TraY family protein, partial [Mailhella sp.]|nr:DotA/TraY family protein [Mailhella sp.]